MSQHDDNRLLSAQEGAAVALDNQDGASPVLLVCEHAANTIPASLDQLGLDSATANSHVAWDPGALGVARELSRLLDATLIRARFSRLVYDCNRPPESPGAMPEKSEVHTIPGNRALTPVARAARVAALYEPFKKTLTNEITRRILQHRPPVLVTIHSFTPVYFGTPRSVELGLLHDEDAALATAMLAAAPAGIDARLNDPYGMADGVTHTLKLHAIPNGLANVMIEVRNDLLASPADQKKIAAELAKMLTAALASLDAATKTEPADG